MVHSNDQPLCLPHVMLKSHLDQMRSKTQKLHMLYNKERKDVHEQLCNLVPPKVQSISDFPQQNGEDILLPYCRLSVTRKYFIPATINGTIFYISTRIKDRFHIQIKVSFIKKCEQIHCIIFYAENYMYIPYAAYF